MAHIEFMDKGKTVVIIVTPNTQLINLLRDAVAITHYRKV